MNQSYENYAFNGSSLVYRIDGYNRTTTRYLKASFVPTTYFSTGTYGIQVCATNEKNSDFKETAFITAVEGRTLKVISYIQLKN